MKLHLKIDKSTFVFIVTVYNAIVSYGGSLLIQAYPVAGVPALSFCMTVGNAGIVLLAAETGNETPSPLPTPPTPSPAP